MKMQTWEFQGHYLPQGERSGDREQEQEAAEDPGTHRGTVRGEGSGRSSFGVTSEGLSGHRNAAQEGETPVTPTAGGVHLSLSWPLLQGKLKRED